MIEADKVALLPGILKLPIKRHFIYPKDKVALSGITLCVNLLETAAQFIVSHYLSEHMGEYFFKEAKVLELFSCHETILPSTVSSLGPVIGYDSYASTSFSLSFSSTFTDRVGWSESEMMCNPRLDDIIVQDISVDPFLPLVDNFFDFVIVPANFQLIQRPRDLFQEINRVLKPGGMAFVGVKL